MRILAPLAILVLAPLVAIAQASKGPQIKPLYGAEGTYLCVALSDDRTKLAVGGRDGKIALWDATSRNELSSMTGHKGSVLAIAFAPKGEFVVSVGIDKMVRVQTLDGKEKGKPIGPVSDVPTCVAVSTDGKRIAYAGWDGTIHQVNAETGEAMAERPGEQGPIFSLAFSPDGKWLASGGRKGTVQIWEGAGELKQHATLVNDDRTVWSVSWSPDSALLAAGADKSVRIWNVADKKVVEDFKGHQAPIRTLTFTEGGKKLVSGSQDKTVRVWDLAKKSAETLSGANGPVTGVAASPDGKTIYAVSDEAVQSARVFVFGKE